MPDPWYGKHKPLPSKLEDFLDGVKAHGPASAELLAPGLGPEIRAAAFEHARLLRELSIGQSCFFVQRLADAMEDAWPEEEGPHA